MRRAVIAAVAIVALGSCGESTAVNESEMPAMEDAERKAARPEPRAEPAHVDCGGRTDVATVHRYFAALEQALESGGPRTRFNAFVDRSFGVTSRGGRTLYFNVKDIGSVTPGRISLSEWREISRRGARSLNNAGWRGCFLDHGKVWFEADGERFYLKLIMRDLPWAPPEKGNALP